MKNGSSFYAFSALHSVGHILGIAPFKLKVTPKKSTTALNRYSFSLSLFYTILYIFLLAYIIINDDILRIVGKGVPKKFLYVNVANIYVGSVTVVALLYFRFDRYANLGVSFKYFNEIEELLKILGCVINYQKLKSILTWAMASQSVAYLCYFTFIAYYSAANLPADLPLFCVKLIPSYQIAVGQFIFSRYIYLIWLNCYQLNKAIRNNVIRDVSRRTGIDFKADKQIFYFRRLSKKSTNGDVLQKLKLVCKAYAKICECSFVLEEYFSGAFFSIIFMSFINSLFGTFELMYIFIAISKGYRNIRYQSIAVRAVRILANSYNLYSIIDICTSCEKEVNYYI